MARTYVFTITKHLYDLVRKVNRYGDVAAGYLTPAQVTDLNQFSSVYSSHWGPTSGTWVPFRQQA